MTDDQQTLLMFKGLIASLSEESQAKVKEAEERLRDVLSSYPDGEAMVAFGFIGAGLQTGGMERIEK
ncbi:Uncharacterised protein [Serratia liquefaciens]|uniref:hypothetical protein n=1 Tax=Serratia liquefaciens TaxID=614 RepID=UPI00218279C7|nr:hypothetical protein [Serratia liquefaciens]CAI2407576.1 Uncharacterised protein [Serratia liquefaciens]